MDDFGDVGSFEKPGLSVESWIQSAKQYIERTGRPISFMNLIFMDDPESIAEGNFDQRTIDLLKMAQRLDLFEFRGSTEGEQVNEVPVDKPYYVAITYDNDLYLTFFKDKRLASVIDWEMYNE